jgi:hypothetical protein
LWGLILYPNYIIDFFIEIILESKEYILIFQFSLDKKKFKIAKKTLDENTWKTFVMYH